HWFGDSRESDIEGGEKALLAIGEELVESAPGDVCASDHLGNRESAVAELGYGLNRRRDDPRALHIGERRARIGSLRLHRRGCGSLPIRHTDLAHLGLSASQTVSRLA